MSLARKCDRCGNFCIPESCRSREGRFNAITLIERTLSSKYYENRTYDLCPNCSNSLLEWLDDCNQKEA